MTQVSDETGCGLGCLLIALTFPVSAVIAWLATGHKQKADALEEQNRILRLKAEREELEENLEKTRAAARTPEDGRSRIYPVLAVQGMARRDGFGRHL